MQIKKINLVLFSMLLSMGINFTTRAMFSKKTFGASAKNFKNIPKYKATSQQTFTANVQDSFQGINNISQNLDKICLENIMGDVNIFENVDSETVHNFFEVLFGSLSSSSKEVLKKWSDLDIVGAIKEHQARLEFTSKSELFPTDKEKAKTLVEKILGGIKETVKNNPGKTALAVGAGALIGGKIYHDYRINKALDKLDKKLHDTKNTIKKEMKKSGKEIEKTKINAKNITNKTVGVKTSTVKLKNKYEQLEKNQENINNKFNKNTNNILVAVEENGNAIKDIKKTSNETSNLINQHSKNTVIIKTDVSEIQNDLAKRGINFSGNTAQLNKLEQDNLALKKINAILLNN